LRVTKWIGRNAWSPPVAAVLAMAVAGYVLTVTSSADGAQPAIFARTGSTLS
jgi:hypothetical protein